MDPSSTPAWLQGVSTGWPMLLAAPFIGSFVATVAFRLPRGEGVALGRSRCPACATPLGAVDLLPLFGWVLRQGHCKSCRAPIDPAYPLIEAGAVGLACWALLAGLPGWQGPVVCFLGWTLLALAAIDGRHYLLPDALTLPLVPAGLLAAWLIPAWPVGVADGAIGTAAGFVAIWAVGWLYRRLRGREGIGLGDAKLLAAAGAWVGWQGLASVVLIAALAGLAVALLAAIKRGQRLDPASRLPFGVFLALGLWLVVLYGPMAFRIGAE